MGFFPQMCSSVLCSNKAKLCSYKDSIPSDWNMMVPIYVSRKSSEVKTWGFSYTVFLLSSSGRTPFFLDLPISLCPCGLGRPGLTLRSMLHVCLDCVHPANQELVQGGPVTQLRARSLAGTVRRSHVFPLDPAVRMPVWSSQRQSCHHSS